MGRGHLDHGFARGVDPAVQGALTRKQERVHLAALDHAELEAGPEGGARYGTPVAHLGASSPGAKDAIYAARSAASARVSDISGIFGCGSSRKIATCAALKPGCLAMVANGGAWSMTGRRCVGVTTWQASHQRCASREPLSASAAWPGCARSATPNARQVAMNRGSKLGSILPFLGSRRSGVYRVLPVVWVCRSAQSRTPAKTMKGMVMPTIARSVFMDIWLLLFDRSISCWFARWRFDLGQPHGCPAHQAAISTDAKRA